MRFMVIVKATKRLGGGRAPGREAPDGRWAATTKSWRKPACMLAGEGLQPSSKGARVGSPGAKRTVIDGPFAETKELIAGFWLMAGEVEGGGDRMGQALPQPLPGEESEIEIRQVFEAEDFGAEFTPGAAGAGGAPARAGGPQQEVSPSAERESGDADS